MMYKYVPRRAPEYLCSKFRKRSEVHDSLTRNNRQLDIPYFKSAAGQRSFRFRSTKMWNDLPNEL